MDAKVVWEKNLKFTGSAGTHSLPLDAEIAVGGGGEGFLPMQLIATGLAGCTSMDVISILRKKRQDVTAFEVQVHAPRAGEHPKVFTSAEIEYFVTGHAVDEAAVLRAIELSATRYCPAQSMLSKVFPITMKYHIYEAGEGGARTLTVSGAWSAPAG
ncbi:MAG: OsmC family protein [Chloroflexi bacterium]|nr:OsmC family protein [Chloroflexota bacterium]